MSVSVCRVYDDVRPGTTRLFVDRLWPRGVRKDDPRIGEWCKEVAPSTELREWYHHHPDQRDLFAARYRQELGSGEQAEALTHIEKLAKAGDVELATATKDPSTSHVPVIVGELAGAGS
ncbi:hypothetical protein GOARA_050_00430 [Gordonia araii NBRC 100433]|uniref:MarR family transcriptional regulator n=1 Tax=Gordonia araii NBRC 100433 TaxID=1073574 RepID=G7H2A6_9ACTN|nr:DUF488 family protein [Gordonia araii]NNG97520.1 DUF488 family protein [Gordonia araii NBRC 100433]GAB09981.1 hypothetical protein GOARA_050_00430 [Gordonia araii NBRC 100433]